MLTIGIGVILETKAGTYLLQERDHNTNLNPGMIAPFGGGLEENEDVYQCAKRELLEELGLDIDASNLNDIGLFASRNKSGINIQMFLAKDIDIQALNLQEGKSIVECTRDAALGNDKVTDFTKEVLRTL